MKTPRNLPVGYASFERIREDGFLYVDKTRHIFELVDKGGFYFLSRPRRFGKSLTLSTLKCLFEGRKELFDGLWISDHGQWEWKPHPIVTVDFNELAHQTPENLEKALTANLTGIGEAHGIQLKSNLLPGRFAELIVALFRKTGSAVVVLVDEYDKPIISHLGKGRDALEIAKRNREVMKYFFGVLKGANVSPCLRFVFFTGVSKFSRVSIFSELNNLEDISMTEDHAEMLGYTQAEVESCFKPHLAAMAEKLGVAQTDLLKQLAVHYNGYRFSRKDARVYNPFSVLSALKQKAFNNYWFETGTPTFLVDLLRERSFPLPRLENLEVDETVFSTYDPENLKPEAILFQTGYITIRDVQDHIYSFDYPNQEVKISFLKHLFAGYASPSPEYSRFLRLSAYLAREQFDDFFETVRAIFASIPYSLESRRDEAYFHTLFYLMVCASGVNARSEVLTCEGRIDLAVEFAEAVFIIEFKCNQGADAALKQIREKAYADPFRRSGKKIIAMGIDFDTEKRNVAEWKWETV